MSEDSEVKVLAVGAVLIRLINLQKMGASAAQVTAPGVVIILSGMKKEGYDPTTLDYLSQELHNETHPQVNLAGIIGHFQTIYDRL